MKKSFLTLLLAGLALCSHAQGSLSLASRAHLRQLRNVPAESRSTQATTVLAMIKLSEGFSAAELQKAGVDIVRTDREFVFANVAIDAIDKVSSHPAVARFELGNTLTPHMSKARLMTKVNSVHKGTDIPLPYTGKGVVCGVVDTGIDPNHINFLDSLGNNRVKQFSIITTTPDGMVVDSIFSEEEVPEATTDSPQETHGTHVLGIMAGGYKGQLTMAQASKATGKATIKEAANPYYGVAYDADIAAAGLSQLNETSILMGVGDVINYAKGDSTGREAKRCVVNLSLGSNIGPHDGSDIYTQYLNRMAAEENAIIVISAGNEGDFNVAVKKEITADAPYVRTFVDGGLDFEDGSTNTIYRYTDVDVWNSDSTEMQVSVVVFDAETKEIVKRLTPSEDNLDGSQHWLTNEGYRKDSTDIVDLDLAQWFNGEIGLYWGLDDTSLRWRSVVQFNILNNMESNSNERYLIGIEANAEAGKHIEMYCNPNFNETQFTSFSSYRHMKVEGWEMGSSDGSINNLACGPNTIAVGSFNTNDYWGSIIDGKVYSYGFEVKDASAFSSYGTMSDGSTLPHVLAPGAAIISSASRYYNLLDQMVAARKEEGQNIYDWMISQGTSMSAPFMAGTIALWLEADPKLTLEQIKEVIAKTSIKDDYYDKG
ncbi:MAG: S8 family serine peptidase, partial [Bacteroidales bacterium]|nr:S8 family serine peptidase [Bacteroidales bacterium]